MLDGRCLLLRHASHALQLFRLSFLTNVRASSNGSIFEGGRFDFFLILLLIEEGLSGGCEGPEAGTTGGASPLLADP